MSDARIVKDVRAIFSRHRMEHRPLRITFKRGRLNLMGKLLPVGSTESPGDEGSIRSFKKTLSILEEELLRINAVNQVTWDIYEWEQIGTEWKRKR